MHIIVRFSTSDPLATLKAPMIRVGQNNFYKHIVMGREVQSGDVETEEWKHPSAKEKKTQQHAFIHLGKLGKT